MDVSYRRRHRPSRLEQLLTCLLPSRHPREPLATRIDFVRSVDIDVPVTQA